MLMFGWFVALCALGASVDLYRARRRRGRVSPRPSVPLRPIAIICGECAGDAIVARQTLLTRDGACDRCQGRSFILASDRARKRPVAQVVRLADERPRRERRKKYA